MWSIIRCNNFTISDVTNTSIQAKALAEKNERDVQIEHEQAVRQVSLLSFFKYLSASA